MKSKKSASTNSTTTTPKPWLTFNGDSFTVDGITTPIAADTLAKLKRIAKAEGVSTEEMFLTFIQQAAELHLAKQKEKIGGLTCSFYMRLPDRTTPNAILVAGDGTMFLGRAVDTWEEPIPAAECDIDRKVSAVEAAKWYLQYAEGVDESSGTPSDILRAFVRQAECARR